MDRSSDAQSNTSNNTNSASLENPVIKGAAAATDRMIADSSTFLCASLFSSPSDSDPAIGSLLQSSDARRMC